MTATMISMMTLVEVQCVVGMFTLVQTVFCILLSLNKFVFFSWPLKQGLNYSVISNCDNILGSREFPTIV